MQVDEEEKLVGGTMDKATLGLGLKLDQIEEEEFADRSSLDSDGAGGRGVVGRQSVKKVNFRHFWEGVKQIPLPKPYTCNISIGISFLGIQWQWEEPE